MHTRLDKRCQQEAFRLCSSNQVKGAGQPGCGQQVQLWPRELQGVRLVSVASGCVRPRVYVYKTQSLLLSSLCVRQYYCTMDDVIVVVIIFN